MYQTCGHTGPSLRAKHVVLDVLKSVGGGCLPTVQSAARLALAAEWHLASAKMPSHPRMQPVKLSKCSEGVFVFKYTVKTAGLCVLEKGKIVTTTLC